MREAVRRTGHEGVERVAVVDLPSGLCSSPVAERRVQRWERAGRRAGTRIPDVAVSVVSSVEPVPVVEVPVVEVVPRRGHLVGPAVRAAWWSVVAVGPGPMLGAGHHCDVDADVAGAGEAEGVLDQGPETALEAFLHELGRNRQRERPTVEAERLDEAERALPRAFGDVRAQRDSASGPEGWCVIAHVRRRPFSFPPIDERVDHASVHRCGQRCGRLATCWGVVLERRSRSCPTGAARRRRVRDRSTAFPTVLQVGPAAVIAGTSDVVSPDLRPGTAHRVTSRP